MNLNISLNQNYLNAAGNVTVTFSFSEAISGFTAADISTAYGGVTLQSTSDGGKTWTGTLNSNGVQIEGVTDHISVDLSGVLDSNSVAGSGVVTSNNYVVDTLGPTIVSFGNYDVFNINNRNNYLYATVGVIFSELVETSRFAMTGSYLDFIDAYTYVNGGFPRYGDDWKWFASSLTVDRAYTNQLTLDLSKVTDQYGNAGVGTVTNPNFYTVDTVAPTATVVVDNTTLLHGQSSTVTIAFSEAVSGLSASDFSMANATVSNLASSDGGTTWTATLTPDAGVTAQDRLQLLKTGGVVDSAGNHLAASYSSALLSIDTALPTGTVEMVSNPVGIAGSQVKIHFSESVNAFDINSLFAEKGTLSNLQKVDGANWTATFTPTSGLAGSNGKVYLAMDTVRDDNGNFGSGVATSASYTVDTVRPTVDITLSDYTLTAGENAIITFTFSEKITDFGLLDLDFNTGSIGGLRNLDDGITWTAIYTPFNNIRSSNNVVTVRDGAVIDMAGNRSVGAGHSAAYVIDNIRPTATIVVADDKLKVGETSLVTITFSEAVTGFTSNDLNAGNGTLSTLTTSDGGISWTATLTPGAGNTSSGNTVTLNTANVTTLAGSPGATVATSNAYQIDTARPSATVAISKNYINNSSAVVTITFSEAIADISNAVIQVGNGTLGTLSSNNGGLTWSAGFTPTPGVNAGGNQIVLDMSSIVDAAGNAGVGLAQSSEYVIDRIAPIPTIALSSYTLLAGQTATITLVFSEVVTGLTTLGISAANGTLSNMASIDGVTWTATFTPTPGINVAINYMALISGNYTDLAGNIGISLFAAPYSIHTVRPTATVDVADSALKIGQTSTVTITFSEAVSGLDIGDFSVASGALSNLSTSDGGITWTATLTPTANVSNSSNVVMLNNTGYLSLHGNSGTGTSSSSNYTVDTKAPTAIIAMADNTLGSGQSTLVTISFSEAVNGFDNADLTVSSGTLSNVSSSDGGITWTATFTASSAINRSQVVITLNQAAIEDLAGNAGVGMVSNPTQALPPSGPTVTVGTADGVRTETWTVFNGVTGLNNNYLSVPMVTSVTDGPDSQLPGVADIPLTVGTGKLLLGLPLGVSLSSNVTSTPQTGASLLGDLQHRLDSITTGTAMDQAFASYLATLPDNTPVTGVTLVLKAADVVPGRPLVINGDGSPMALVIDASALPAGTVIMLNNVGFAAVTGSVTLRGGEGDNYVIGDNGAQNIVLGAGNDTLLGGGGDDIIGSAGGNDVLDGGDGNDLVFGGIGNDTLSGGNGNDVLQGGRSDQGKWTFYLDAQGQVGALHATLQDGVNETVKLDELVATNPLLDFSGAGAGLLGKLAVLYHAAFGRVPDLAGLNAWIRAGASIEQAAHSFALSAEFQQGAGKLDNAALVQTLYGQAFGEDGAKAHASEQAVWIAKLNAASDASTARGELLLSLAQDASAKAHWTAADGSLAVGTVTLATEQGWIAGSGDDVLYGGAGNDRLVGGDGIDTVVYDGKLADYQFILNAQGEINLRDSKSGDIDTLLQIEKGQFSDGTVDLGFTNSSIASLQQVGLMYQTVLDRAADFAGLAFWDARHLDAATLAQSFIDSAEFQSHYGALSNSAFAQAMASNALKQAPSAGMLQSWTAYLDTHSRAEMVAALIGTQDVLAAQYGTAGLVLI